MEGNAYKIIYTYINGRCVGIYEVGVYVKKSVCVCVRVH